MNQSFPPSAGPVRPPHGAPAEGPSRLPLHPVRRARGPGQRPRSRPEGLPQKVQKARLQEGLHVLGQAQVSTWDELTCTVWCN